MTPARRLFLAEVELAPIKAALLGACKHCGAHSGAAHMGFCEGYANPGRPTAERLAELRRDFPRHAAYLESYYAAQDAAVEDWLASLPNCHPFKKVRGTS